MKLFRGPLLLAILFLLAAPAARGEITLEKEFYLDDGATLGIQDLLAREQELPWKALGDSALQLGPTRARAWIRFRIPPADLKYDPNDPLMLQVPNAYLRRVSFYRVLDGKVTLAAHTGTSVSISQRGPAVLPTTPFTFRVSSPRDSATVYYLSAESIFPLNVPVKLTEAPDYAKSHWTRMFVLGLFFGFFLLAAGFNAFLALSLRSGLYRNYSLFVASVTLTFLTHEGLSMQLLWPESPVWSQRELYLFGFFAMFFYALFVREFLESRRVAAWLDQALMAVVAAALIGTFWLMFTVNLSVSTFNQTMAWVANLIVLMIATKALIHGVRSARYFFLSSLVFNLSVVLFQLQELGVIWLGGWLATLPMYGTAIEVLLLSFALADRIRLTKRELEEQRAVVVHSEKMSALGRLAGEVSHEINNPLAIIHGNAALIRNLEAGPQAKECADIIERAAKRLSHVVKGMRAFTRDTRNDPLLRTPLSSIFQDVELLCGERARRLGLSLMLPAVREEAHVMCRASEICQVLVNLINNSFDALEGVAEPEVRVDWCVSGDLTEISVSDNGRGVPPAIRRRILEPFFTTKATGSGLGLGLSISASIVRSHGSSLELDETASSTRFVFRLSRAE